MKPFKHFKSLRNISEERILVPEAKETVLEHFNQKFLDEQESLGEGFETVLNEHLWELYDVDIPKNL